jgi:lipopolysaccharide transport system permease protein/teichoic acid transport system permease protein
VGSYLGLFWAFLDPLAMVAILWFVFSVGLKARVSGDAPFVAYLLTGMVAYNFVSDALSQSTGAIRAYAFLIQKANFRASILPLVKVNSALLLHLVFVLLVLVILIATGIYPSFYWLQVLYYLTATLFFLLGMSWLLSALGVFLKDMSHIVTIFLRFGFWLTPIVWSMDIVPDRLQPIFKINPLFYIVQGYRDALLYGVPFWAHPAYALYFWSFSLVTGALGVLIFLRLRPHFAEVL